jgi:hypothetical protein
MAPDPAVQAFIKRLGQIDSADEREKLVKRVLMAAADTAPDEAFTPDVTRLREYLAKEIPVPPSLVWPTIAVRGEITTTLGRAGKGKTTLNLNRIFAWACGKPLFDGWTDHEGREYLKPEAPLKTLIAENEGNAGMFHAKVKTLLEEGPLDPSDQEQCLDNLWIHGDGGYSGMKLDNDEGVKKLRGALEICEPDILFIEPFRSLWRGEENSATDMAKVVDNMVAIATDFQCAIILSHHERKGGVGEDNEKMSAGRGSTVLEGVVAVMENFESVKDGKYREMTWSKARYLPPPTPVRMEWSRETGWYEWIPITNVDEGIIACLREADDEPLNAAGIAEATGEKKAVVNKRLNELVKDKRVKKMASVSNGAGSTGFRYRLPTDDNGPGLAV